MSYQPSEHDVENLDRIILGYGDWFDAQLFRLINKADPNNLARLRLAYPYHVAEYQKWRGDAP